MRASRPTAARGRVPFPFGQVFATVCRGGPWPSCGTLRRHSPRGTMQASSPTEARYNRRAALCPFGRGPTVVRRGGIYPSRGTLRRREPGGYGIRPYRGLWRRRACGFPAGRHVAPARRAGVHARRTLEISKNGALLPQGPDHFQHPRTPAPSTNARKISSPAGPLFSGWNCRPVTLARCTAAQTSRPPNSITAAQSCARAGRAW